MRQCSAMDGGRKRKGLTGFAVNAAALLLVACTGNQVVGTHRYRVPTDHLIRKEDYPFFLPRLEDDGFIFVLNPSDDLTEQRTVLVQKRSMVCARAKGLRAYVNKTICASQTVEWRNRRWRKDGDATLWTFSPGTQSGPSAPAPFVSCFKMEIPGHPGLCHATLPAGDLALTISLNADELPRLEDRFDEAVHMLTKWEVSP